PRLHRRTAGPFHPAVPDLGQFRSEPAPLVAAGHLAADQVDAGHPRHRRTAAARVHAAAAEGIPGHARRGARAVAGQRGETVCRSSEAASEAVSYTRTTAWSPPCR